MTQSTTFQILDLLVYTVWACLKGVTPYNAFKEKPTNKNHYNDNYSAFHIRDASLSFVFCILLTFYMMSSSNFNSFFFFTTYGRN